MSITVYAHITETTEVTVKMRSGNAGDYVTLEVGDLELPIRSRAKALEIAGLLESVAQKWGDEK